MNDYLRSYSQEMEREREMQQERLESLSSQLLDDIANDEDESEYAAANERVQEILSDPNACMSLTGFLPVDIEKLVTVSEIIFNTSRKGRRILINPIDFIVLLLQFLRCYPRFERGAFVFNLKTSTYEKYIKTAFEALHPVFTNEFITIPSEHCDIPFLAEFPDASYIVDATVQKIYTPQGQFVIAKSYFSGKHYCYSLKSQVIVDAMGAALDVVSGIPGTTHDMQVFKDNFKSFNDRVISVHPDDGPKTLADKGYISKEYEDVLITPFKGRPIDLDDDRNEFNSTLASFREVVERFFCRMKGKFAIMNHEYRGNRDDYHKYSEMRAALTNFEIRECDNPLSQSDSEFYQLDIC